MKYADEPMKFLENEVDLLSLIRGLAQVRACQAARQCMVPGVLHTSCVFAGWQQLLGESAQAATLQGCWWWQLAAQWQGFP